LISATYMLWSIIGRLCTKFRRFVARLSPTDIQHPRAGQMQSYGADVFPLVHSDILAGDWLDLQEALVCRTSEKGRRFSSAATSNLNLVVNIDHLTFHLFGCAHLHYSLSCYHFCCMNICKDGDENKIYCLRF